MEVYKDKYLVLNYSETHKYIEMLWLEASEAMTEKEYKRIFLEYVKVIEKYKPKGVLVNALNTTFTINPKLQDWTNENVFAFSLSIGLNKAAFIVSKDFISQLSIEQTMEEQEGEKFVTRYFTEEEEAKKWLIRAIA